MHQRRHLWPGGIGRLARPVVLMPSVWAAERGGRGAHQPRQVADHPDRSTSSSAAHPVAAPVQAAGGQDGGADRGHQEVARGSAGGAGRGGAASSEENAARLRRLRRSCRHPRTGAQGGRRRAAKARRGGPRRGAAARRVRQGPDGAGHSAGARGAAPEVAELATAVAEKLIHKSLREEDHAADRRDALAGSGDDA